MANDPSMDHHLNVLPAMLNDVLIHTAKTLRDPLFHSPQHSGLARRRLADTVRPANDEFQNALSELETEILQAKAVMERDLSRIRKRRAERDRQAGRIPPSPQKEPQVHESRKEAIQATDTTIKNGESKDSDTKMEDVSHVPDNQVNGIIDMDDISKALGNTDPSTLFNNMPQGSQSNAGLAISMPTDTATTSGNRAENPPANTSNESIRRSASISQRLETAQPAVDFDFESMFSDLERLPQDAPLDLNLDVSNLPNAFDTSTMPDLNLDTDAPNAPPAPNEDINSLLPGLESFVDATNDSTAPNASANIAAAARSMQQPAAADGTVSDSMPIPTDNGGVGDSTFDDLFGSTDFGNMGEHHGDGQDLASGGEFGDFGAFDDDWFKTDG